MPMTLRERVACALRGDMPDQIPFTCYYGGGKWHRIVTVGINVLWGNELGQNWAVSQYGKSVLKMRDRVRGRVWGTLCASRGVSWGWRVSVVLSERREK